MKKNFNYLKFFFLYMPFCYNQFVPLGVHQYAVGVPFGHKLLILNIFSYPLKKGCIIYSPFLYLNN